MIRENLFWNFHELAVVQELKVTNTRLRNTEKGLTEMFATKKSRNETQIRLFLEMQFSQTEKKPNTIECN